jgi:hypothetical protein
VSRELRIGRPVASPPGRVQAEVDGRVVWFASADARLLPRPEAFAGAFAIPAMAAGKSVRIAAPLDPAWRDNVGRAMQVFRGWWRHPEVAPPAGDGGAPGAGPDAERYRVACFTGGADSFHTLLHGAHAVDRLLFVHGFDIPLADTRRAGAFEPTLRRVAAARGKRAILVRTNLREHPLFAAESWERTHGAALAAAGHVLAGAAQLVIPSTYTHDHEQPWGSHPTTDPLWSSATLSVVHDDASLNRRQKLRALAGEPLVWDALRVCWENRAPTGNCSACEKCVRTMLVLHLAGALPRFTTFDRRVPLARRVRALGFVAPHLRYVYQALLEDGLDRDAEIAAAVRWVLGRPAPRAWRWRARSLLRRLRARLASS